MSSHDVRLGRLVTRWPPPKCPTCRLWTPTNVVVVGHDGPMRPEVCPACGRPVPIRKVLKIIRDDDPTNQQMGERAEKEVSARAGPNVGGRPA